ncbi:MAG: DnaD domain protein [Eubacterium sp.]|jgi:DnaD/phage-associated family protein|nr:DnaD domain protein [Eubacterium sp.]
MSFKLDLGEWSSVFAVPTPVVDYYIKLAHGNAIKVLLYFLRYGGEELSATEVAEKTGIAESDVSDALVFWVQAGLLTEDNGRLAPAKENIEKMRDPMMFKSVKKIPDISRDPLFMPKDIAIAVKGSEEISFLFKECERLYGRPLKPAEQQMLMIISEENGLRPECALMLIEYCFSIDKATPGYIKKVAKGWVEKEIDSIAKAEEEIRQMRAYGSVESEMKRLFDRNSAFSEEQKAFISKWTSVYNMTVEMIDAAYQKTLNSINKMDFKYMDKILSSWWNKGYRLSKEIDQDKKSEKMQSSSFDIEEIQKAQLQKHWKE